MQHGTLEALGAIADGAGIDDTIDALSMLKREVDARLTMALAARRIRMKMEDETR